MSVYPPVEILYDRSKVFPGLLHVLEKKCGTSCRGLPFPAAKKTLKMFLDEDYFDAKGKTPFEAWPKDLVKHLNEGESGACLVISWLMDLTLAEFSTLEVAVL
jgi:hypothetical protein